MFTKELEGVYSVIKFYINTEGLINIPIWSESIRPVTITEVMKLKEF